MVWLGLFCQTPAGGCDRMYKETATLRQAIWDRDQWLLQVWWTIWWGQIKLNAGIRHCSNLILADEHHWYTRKTAAVRIHQPTKQIWSDELEYTKIGLADLGWIICAHLSAVQIIDIWKRFGGRVHLWAFTYNRSKKKYFFITLINNSWYDLVEI